MKPSIIFFYTQTESRLFFHQIFYIYHAGTFFVENEQGGVEDIWKINIQRCRKKIKKARAAPDMYEY